MKAIVYHQYGGADVLQLADIDRPAIGPKDILIKVVACEVTKADCELRSLKFPVKWFALPLRLVMGWKRPRRPVLGSYFSGVVERVGAEVTRYQTGDEVVGSTGFSFGAYAEYMALPESASVQIKPAKLTHSEAAGSLLGGLNAIHFINLAALKSGQKILINGAGGSIGLFALQLAKNIGAEITVVDAAHKETLLRLLGAMHFIDYQQQDFTRTEERYDVIFDMVASTSYRRVLNCLKPQGRYLNGNPRLSLMLASRFYNLFNERAIHCSFAKESPEELHDLMVQLSHDHLQTPIDQTFAMGDIVAAHRRVETEQRVGAVIVQLSADSETAA